MTSNPETSVLTTGLVLCGGRGQRLGGIDKGLHDVGGRALVEYVFERIAPFKWRLVIPFSQSGARLDLFELTPVAEQPSE